MQQYVQGSVPQIEFTTTNSKTGALIDPPQVLASVLAPDETTWYRYYYGDGTGNLTRNGVGDYTVIFPLGSEQVGVWEGTLFTKNADNSDNGAVNITYQVLASNR